MNHPYRILIVEDSPTQALNLRQVFEQQGWDVAQATTSDRAMEAINRSPPDLIVMDYFLPDMRGDELCRRIRMSVGTRDILILMLTADQTQQAELRGLDSGADDFLAKSSDSDLLLVRIRMLLQRGARRAPIRGPADSYFRKIRLLMIDDSTTYLEYLKLQLASEGYQIDTASSGTEGLERLHGGGIDCVLVDLVMPGIDGIEVCRRINELRITADNPLAVLMLTGQENKDDLARALDAGADDFVGKSSDIVVLKGRIRALLRRKFYQEENQRISGELKARELEAIRARAATEIAEARAAMVEELEKTATELRRSNRDLEQFASVVSHDLKEPLRMVIMFTTLLAEKLAGQLDVDADKWIHYVTEGAHRMRQLIDDLLDYARVGRKGAQFESIDLNDVANQSFANLSAAIKDSDGRIELDELPMVIGNKTLLTQLFQNLIANALKFRGSERPLVHVSAKSSGGEWQIAVQDNGIGIEPQYFDRIFQIFQRLHTREKFPGTGIGLAVCQRIVELHGGRIWVESEAEQGAKFYFTLTAATAEPAKRREPLAMTHHEASAT